MSVASTLTLPPRVVDAGAGGQRWRPRHRPPGDHVELQDVGECTGRVLEQRVQGCPRAAASNASLVGAKTVKGPSPDRVSTRPASVTGSPAWRSPRCQRRCRRRSPRPHLLFGGGGGGVLGRRPWWWSSSAVSSSSVQAAPTRERPSTRAAEVRMKRFRMVKVSLGVGLTNLASVRKRFCGCTSRDFDGSSAASVGWCTGSLPDGRVRRRPGLSGAEGPRSATRSRTWAGSSSTNLPSELSSPRWRSWPGSSPTRRPPWA